MKLKQLKSKVKAGAVKIRGQIIEAIVFLRSGRRPLLLVRLNKYSSDKEYNEALLSVYGNTRIQRDYIPLVCKGSTNNEDELSVYALRENQTADIEVLKRELGLGLVKRMYEHRQKKEDFQRLKHGNLHRR